MNEDTAKRLSIGDWSVDPATNDISRGSERVHLETATGCATSAARTTDPT